MVRLKKEALRLAVMSLGVLAGGVLFLAGVLNLVLLAQGDPSAPPAWQVWTVTLLGALLFGVPLAVTMREMLRARSEAS